MSICRGCPHFDFAIAIVPEGARGPRIDMDCRIGQPGAGMREACQEKPAPVDTGERRRKTDMGGNS